jgi:hypothetical protein
MKCGVVVILKSCRESMQFREDGRIDSRTLLYGLNKFLSSLSTFPE